MSAPAGLVDGLLAGRYRLTSRLAAGAVGEVWRARDLLLNREVAVKTLRPEIAEDAEARERFRAEARSTGRLSHPGIARVFDAGDDDGRAWLVLELVEGSSLQSVLRSSGPLSPEQTLDLVGQAAAALQAAHDSGVVHRDVKPGNLLLRPDGAVKVTDFGIASVAGSARLTQTGQVVGTAAYLSPEQAAGAAATPLSDLYALGVVAYECLRGTVPFAFDNPVAVLLAHTRTPPPPLPEDVPAPVRELVAALLAKDPGSRPASAREVVRRAAAVRAALARPGAASAPTAAGIAPVAFSAGVAQPPRPTEVLPVAGPPSLPPVAAPPAPLPARPVPPARPTDRAGLAGRPGQRRAVRVTALLLGLLAVALGLRESAGEPTTPAPAPPPAASRAPTPSAPPAQPSAGAGAPAAPAPAAPGARVEPDVAEVAPPPVPARPDPAQPEPAVADPGAVEQGRDAPGEAQDQADKAAEKAEKDAEKAADKAEQRGDGGNDGDNGNGSGNGSGGGKDG